MVDEADVANDYIDGELSRAFGQNSPRHEQEVRVKVM